MVVSPSKVQRMGLFVFKHPLLSPETWRAKRFSSGEKPEKFVVTKLRLRGATSLATVRARARTTTRTTTRTESVAALPNLCPGGRV